MNLNSNSMNMKTRHILTAVSLIILAACTNDSSKKTTLEDQTIIAQTTDINGQPITASAPKHIIIDKDENGDYTTKLFSKEQTYKSMLKILGY